MRPPILIAVLLACAAGMGGIFLLKQAGTRPPAEPVTASPAPAKVAPSPAALATPAAPIAAVAAPPRPPGVQPPATPTPTITNPPAEAPQNQLPPEVQAKLARLEQLQANYDRESLVEILSELTNSNPVIRHAALEATTQFRDRAAIPALRDLAATTTDPGEKQALLEAVEYLTLPTYTEVMEAKKQLRMQESNPQ